MENNDKNGEISENESKIMSKILKEMVSYDNFCNNTDKNNKINVIQKTVDNDAFRAKLNSKKNCVNVFKFTQTKPIMIFHKLFTSENHSDLFRTFSKIIYFSYRKNFAPIKNGAVKKYSSDSGWGCMIRCSQMMMARAVYKYFRGKKWSLADALMKSVELFMDNPFDCGNMPEIFDKIIVKFFNDLTSENNKRKINSVFPPFSINILCQLGELYNKGAGDWFSDVNMCYSYKLIAGYFNLLEDMEIFTFQSFIEFYKVI